MVGTILTHIERIIAVKSGWQVGCAKRSRSDLTFDYPFLESSDDHPLPPTLAECFDLGEMMLDLHLKIEVGQ